MKSPTVNLIRSKKFIASFLLVSVIILGETIGLPGLGLTKAQEVTACILVLAAIFWVTELVSLFVVSFLILALELVWLAPLVTTAELAKPHNLFYGAFFSNIILLFLGGFVLSALMQKYGLDLAFAQSILRKTDGKPAITLLGIIITCAFLSMWMSNTATTAMMLTIVFPLLKHIPGDHKFRIALVLSIPFACNIGGIGTPIGTPPNAIALSYLAKMDIKLGFLQWMLLTQPFVIVFLLLLWRLLLFIYPPSSLKLELTERHTSQMGLKHWATIGIFLITALGWFLGTTLNLSTGTVALFPIIAAFWFGLLDTNDFRKLPWDILYIISGGIALGVALSISGLGEVMVAALPTTLSPYYLVLVGMVVAGAMSTVMSNTATAGLLIPLVMSVNATGSQMLMLVVGITLMCSMAMSLPVTTPPNAIAFSSRAITTKDMMLTGTIITVVGFLVMSLLGPVYWTFILNNV